MEERRTAAVVLGIIAVIAMVLFVAIPKADENRPIVLNYRQCRVSQRPQMPEEVNAIHNKFALCLCKLYRQKPDTALANRIIRLYKEHGNALATDSLKLYYVPVDSLIKNEATVFDTVVYLE